MGNLTATIRLESTDIWPTSVKINRSIVEQANGDVDIQTIVIPGADKTAVYLLEDPSNTTYFYVAAASTNGGSLAISYVRASIETRLAVLRPGDFMWLPLLNDAENTYIQVTNSDIADAKIDVLFANRG